MDNSNINPLYIVFLYILRCLVPLGIMLGISFLLRKFGLIKPAPPPPQDWNNHGQAGEQSNGGMAHG